MIRNLHRNCTGTVSFDGQFQGMRKRQDFIVYPMHGDTPTHCKVQSDTRIGRISLTEGTVTMSPPRAGGAYGVHLAGAQPVGALSGEELLLLRAAIEATAGPSVGSRGVTTCNTGARGVLTLGATL